MPSFQRFNTDYPGVYYIKGTSVASAKPERIYYIYYRKAGKQIEEKAGRQYQDHMTPARAAHIRTLRINDNQVSNKEKRAADLEENLREQNRWTIDRLWQEYKTRKFDLKALRKDENRYTKHILPNFGKKEPSQLNQFEIDRFKINLLKTLKPQTVKLALSLLLRIINFGIKKQLCKGITFKIEMPKVDNITTEDLSPEQLKNYLNVLDNEPDIVIANFLRLCFYTGMRKSELLSLQWNHIDFHRGFIRIVNPKGGRDQSIPLNDNARKVLTNQPRMKDNPFVFPGRNGTHLSDVVKKARIIRNKAGLPSTWRPVHALRHAFASMLASSGQVDLYTLQKLLTHKSPGMTQRYAHLRDESLRKASNLTGELIKSAISQPLPQIILKTADQ